MILTVFCKAACLYFSEKGMQRKVEHSVQVRAVLMASDEAKERRKAVLQAHPCLATHFA